MNNMKTTIWVTFCKEGFHKYPQAKTDPKLASVSYLGDIHRHLFGFRVEIEVFHDDREIEFHLFKREMEGLFASGNNIDHKSCEMLAQGIVGYLQDKYCIERQRYISVSVDEDGECGSTVTING